MIGSRTVAQAGSSPARDETEFHSWEILLLLSAASVLLSWYNTNQVMTREMYHQVLGGQLDGSRIDVQYDLAQRFAVWGYVFVPLVLWLRVALVAMVAQLVLLLSSGDVPLGRIFRLAAIAHIPLFVGGVVRIMWLAHLATDEFSKAALANSPLSLASVLYTPASYETPGYQLASMINVFELGWCVVMTIGIARLMRVSLPKSAAVSGGVWLTFTILQWSVALYLSGPA